MEEQTPHLAGRPKREKLIAIKMTKATLFLTEPELSRLLAKDPALWTEAVRRGKYMKRARAARGPKIKEGADRD
ncbi:hypothetical protein SAMN02745218_02922 [Desulfofundulus australicus DSM 11792]|uniref:Uncharacterized protein n=1 Tax=Desulfofundulus australicus DSM 11792 TaxID=1121425 RepID=A0A1M5DUM3_9FIRM|nr:hypothetical protein [Desulfofundulus australicus]SHF70639.1 hypothetical protein SAMN02745218_02922 [Desulfofundulus australicus DSM 11792]